MIGLVVVFAAGTGCKSKGPVPGEGSANGASPKVGTTETTGAHPGAANPHAGMGDTHAAGDPHAGLGIPPVGAGPKLTDTGLLDIGAIALKPPEGWKVEPPSSSMRKAQMRAEGEAGPAELVVFYFGPGQGGDPMSNAARWANQLTQPDGTPSTERVKVTSLDTSLPVQLVEITGDYGGGMGGAPIPGAMLLGGIAEGPDAPWFFKMVGPESTVKAHREAFVEMMGSLRVSG